MAWDLEQLSDVQEFSHNTVIDWVRESGEKLPETEEIEDVPEVGELDELQTFVGSK
ncbi:IS1 family transposase, partial [Pseudanabaena sp. UWO310]